MSSPESDETRPDRDAAGYRVAPRGGPALRTDVVDVYVFRENESAPGGVEFLQLLRNRSPLAGTWQPLMGHIEEGETAAACAQRELAEEVGLRAGGAGWKGLWALEQVHPYYLPDLDAVVLSPRFAARVAPEWTPTLDDEHSDFRWVAAERVNECFYWPGQKKACREIIEEIVRGAWSPLVE